MSEDIDPEVAANLILKCDQYPYHELVAYSAGITIKELQDWLERGAAAGEELPNLRDFARDYCAKDADYAARIFKIIQDMCEQGMKGNVGPLWKWFDTRWPCGNPLAITTLLAGERAEALSLQQMFRDPSQTVRDALRETLWFHARDFSNPTAELARLLDEEGYRREIAPRPQPGPATEG